MNQLITAVLTLSFIGMSISCSKKEDLKPNAHQKDKTEEPFKPNNKPTDSKDEPGSPQGNNSQTPVPPQIDRPTDREMSLRATAKWKVQGDDLYKKFDLETLWLDGKTEKYTIQYLKDFIELSSSAVEGRSSYVFTAEDYKETEISTISYNEYSEVIKLKFRYKGTESKELALEFKKSDYYQQKVRANSVVASGLYLTGVVNNPSIFLADLFEYDTNRYALELGENRNPTPDYGNQSLVVYATLSLRKGNKELTPLQLQVGGFRSFSKLKDDLSIMAGSDLLDYAKEQYTKNNNDQMFISRFNARLSNNKNLLQYLGRSEDMIWDGWTFKSAKNEKSFLDLYFPKTKLIITDAKFVTKDGRTNLHVELMIQAINDIAMEDLTFTFSLRVPTKN